MSGLRLWAAEKVLLALGVIALARTALGWFVTLPREDMLFFCLVMMGQQLLFYGLPALLLKGEKNEPAPVRERLSVKNALGIVGAAALQQLALTLLTLILGQWLAFMGLSVQTSHMPLPTDLREGLLALAALALAPALCEESLFRGRLDEGLQTGFSPRASLFLTAGLFALMHGQLAALPAHLAAGLMLTVLCRRFGLKASVLYHFVFNGVSLALGLWEKAALWQEGLMAHPSLLMALTGLLLLLGAVCGWALAKGLTLKPGEKAPLRCWAWAGGVTLLLLPAYLIELLPR